MSTELKVVMFTDQVKFTTNTAHRTYAEIKQIAGEQNDLTVEVLHLTRGTLLKDTGDGCLAQFSSVVEAVQAGVLIQRRVAERNGTRLAEYMRFELRIGIDVGELVVLEDGDLRGDAANRCARICSECMPGYVYLSDAAAGMLKDNEVKLEPVDALLLKGIEGETVTYRVSALHVPPQDTPNPFIWRGGITRAKDFFNREAQQRTLHAYLHGRQNCQVVGQRRIGKTSLLRQIERASAWERSAVAAYLDLQNPRCFTLSGWLTSAARQLQWPTTPTTLTEFADRVGEAVSHERRTVLCLDEFEELTMRRSEFTRDFFLTLRSCAQIGLSIVTASRRPLSELTERGDPSSPFYNTFPVVRLGPFNPEDAHDFVSLHRHGVSAFTLEERTTVLDFAKGHPLALQVVCFHILEAKQDGKTLAEALRKAADDMNAHLPDGW
jgi:uncharacterized protein